MSRRSFVFPLAVLLVFAGACGGDADTSGDMSGDEGAMESPASAMESRRVEIASPSQGSTVEGPSVTVDLAAFGFQVTTAGDTTANSGHHHLFLDRDVSAPDVPIPAEEGYIVHMGDGSTTYTFENVEPGQHRLIAVVGDAFHVPVAGLQDTIQFTVQ